MTGEAPVWLDNVDMSRTGTASFRVEEGHRYLASAMADGPSPRIRDGRTVSTSLRKRAEGAEDADIRVIQQRQKHQTTGEEVDDC